MIFQLAILLFAINAHSQVTFRWLGTSGFILTDHQTTLAFDPAMTHPKLSAFLPFQTIQSDPVEVDYWLNQCATKKIDATFVNHAHYDHVIDAPYLVKKYGGKLYGSSSVVNVGLGHGLNPAQVDTIKAETPLQVGGFKVTPFLTPHAPHFLDVLLMDGHIDQPLIPPTSLWNYKVGDTYSFLIEHGKTKILFQAIGRTYSPDVLKNIQVDTLLLVIANRLSSENLIQNRIVPSRAKTVIPLHHDNFFLPMKKDGPFDLLWGIRFDEFKDKFQKQTVNTKLIEPKYCEAIEI